MFSTISYLVFLPFGLLEGIQVHASGGYFVRFPTLNFLLSLIAIMRSIRESDKFKLGNHMKYSPEAPECPRGAQREETHQITDSRKHLY